MASEEAAGAEDEDIDEEDDPEDSKDATDPEDEVTDFIDELEAPPVVAPPGFANPDYDPKCPGLNKRRCKVVGEDNTHLRKKTIR